ncbi:related to Monothiol glutaredoxin-7 [Saccharomycodes ludwigii]|uniref:Related to Monothiol glutaredoxin-7 n=1 Tax=Saccharomycodes ludwigii TaxID=36035 RepID=A0A376B558_9ASCO|nr:hypothetical protein SCDLUD_002400 [Saccharomycodes ludwigii]KAH3900939.1 hypothetical protein SCDLUD_002400 [Saccharomycodes ludwigii]SSD59825.1 related to Monothiol glutaredoxin-7 [Saccharomycodes ludwigii]
MLNKKNIRILSITALLLVVIYLLLSSSVTNSIINNGEADVARQQATGKTKTSKNLVNLENVEDPEKVQQKFEEQQKELDHEVEEIQKLKDQLKTQEERIEELEEYTPGSTTETSYDANTEYNQLILKYPVIIFSKSYCPYSKSLKELLVGKGEYIFDPKPQIIELDLVEHGSELQEVVGKLTGRTTVPNLIINGISRGGNDEIQLLEKEGGLFDKLKEWGGVEVQISSSVSNEAGVNNI